MFVVSETPVGRVLTKVTESRKVVTVDGEIKWFGKKKSMLLPLESKIAICKVNHWEQHNIRMTVNKRSLYYDAMAERYNLGEPMGVDEEEILLASLEVLKTL